MAPLRLSSSDSGAPDSYPGGGLCNSGVRLHIGPQTLQAKYPAFNRQNSGQYRGGLPGTWRVKQPGRCDRLLNGSYLTVCDSGSLLSAILDARIGVLAGLENRARTERLYRFNSCRIRQFGWCRCVGRQRASKTRGAVTGSGSTPPPSATLESKALRERTRLESAGCPKGHGLRLVYSPPISLVLEARYGTPNPKSSVQLVTGLPFTCGLPISQRRFERRTRRFDSFRVIHSRVV
jgi:hypothetical protein